MDLCSPCLEGKIGGGGPVVLQSNVWGFNHMHLSYFSPQQTALGRCLNLCLVHPYKKSHNPKFKTQNPRPNREDWGPTLQLNRKVYFYWNTKAKVLHTLVWGCWALTGLGGWKMSALPEVSSDIADIGRQLKSPRAGCIIRNKNWDWFYLELVVLVFNRNSSTWTTHAPSIQINRT